MRKLINMDFYGQSMFIVVMFLMTSMSPLFNEEGVLVSLLLMCVWQLYSSVIGVWTRGSYWHQRTLHLFLTGIYVILLGVGALLVDYITNPIISNSFLIFCFSVPAGLSVFYYIITYKTWNSGKTVLV